MQAKVIPFVVDRNIPREIADKVATLAIADKYSAGGQRFTIAELSAVILVAIGTYRELVGK